MRLVLNRTLTGLLLSGLGSAYSVCVVFAQDDGYDVYANDDAVECALMVDLAPHVANHNDAGQDDLWVRGHLATALTPARLELCDPESSIVLYAIVTDGIDDYGQPKWDKVRYLAEYDLPAEDAATFMEADSAMELSHLFKKRE